MKKVIPHSKNDTSLTILVHVYTPPRPDELQDILTNHDVTLNQLREKAEIKQVIDIINNNLYI